MGNKIGLILGIGLFLQIILLSADVIGLQMAMSRGYLMTNNINRYIAINGGIDNGLQEYVYQNLGVYLECVNDCFATSGQAIDYQFTIKFNPIFSFIKESSNNFLIRQKAFVD